MALIDGVPDDEDDIKRTGLLQVLFGYQSILSDDEFLERLQSADCKWILDPAAIRKRFNFLL